MSDPIDPIDDDDFDGGWGHSIYFTDFKKTGIIPAVSIAALVWVSFGIKRYAEVYFALACQAADWYCGHRNPDAMWNALAGIQAGRGQYEYIYLPTLLTAYESFENYNKNNGTFTYGTTMVLGFYGLGFLLGKYRII